MLYPEEFALRLAQLREKKGVSAREMSLAIGQNHGYINSIESGKNLPTMKGFFYICDYLGIQPNEFFNTELDYPEALHSLVEELSRLDKEELDALHTFLSAINKKKKATTL